MAKMTTLQDLFVEELRDLYNAENQLIKALPKMAKAASSEELRKAFTDHLEQTRGHAERLEQIEERLELLRTLKRKYGDSIPEILRYGEETADRLNSLSNREERGAPIGRQQPTKLGHDVRPAAGVDAVVENGIPEQDDVRHLPNLPCQRDRKSPSSVAMPAGASTIVM